MRRPPLRSCEDAQGPSAAMGKSKTGPGEGTSMEEAVGSHIPLLFSCFYGHLANVSKVSREEGACEPSMEEARRAFSTGREYR
jgi:hypothetical protein